VGDALDHEWFCERAEAEIARMASVASGAGLSAVVPTCPGWTVARLVKHTGIIHRWATEIVATRAAARIEQRDLDVGLPDSEAGYPSWLAAGAAPLGAALRAAGPDTPVWAWGPAQSSGWWARRMLHETTVHRADVELAADVVPDVDPVVAADGIEEFLANLPTARRPSEHLASLPAGASLHLHATDADGEWLIRIAADGGGVEWSRGHSKATTAVRGPVAELLLFTYGRVPGTDPRLTVFGDPALLEVWQEKTAL
jgi:uncharacterized protein (TIGR03083 family)